MSPLLADTRSAKVSQDVSALGELCVEASRLITVRFRVRSQRSFDVPIAPLNISSWIPLLDARSRPTGSVGT